MPITYLRMLVCFHILLLHTVPHRIKTYTHSNHTFPVESYDFQHIVFVFVDTCVSTPKNAVSLFLGSWASSGLKTQIAINSQWKIQTIKLASCPMKTWKVNVPVYSIRASNMDEHVSQSLLSLNYGGLVFLLSI